MITKREVLMTLGELAEGELLLKDAQLFPIGEWSHPQGKINIDFPRARRFVEQFQRQTAGQRLPVFYIHSDKSNVSNPQYGKAAGWFTNMRADEVKGVLVDIELTTAAADAVRNREYKYLSAEYFDKVQLPHHKTPESDVIVGAALVNRPHLKGMNPILNEETGHQFISVAESREEEGGPMDPVLVQLAKLAGIELSEDEQLTDEQRSAIKTYLESNETTRVIDLEAENAALKKRLEDTEDPDKAKVKNLAEAGFADEAKLLSEYRGERLVKTLSEPLPNGSILSPAVEAKILEYALESNDTHLHEAFRLVVSGKGIVDLTEHGSVGDNDPEDIDDDSGAKLLALADVRAKENDIEFEEAFELVSQENPKLWNSYQASMGSKQADIGGE